MKISSPDSWSRNLMFGLAIAGFLWCGQARAAIALQDGSTNKIISVANSTSISTNFTVTAGASVLVVSLFDRNNVGFESAPTSLSWGAQTIQQVAGEVTGLSNPTFSTVATYYLYNPTPGTQTITATDPNGVTPTWMAMQVYTLNGVDTSNPNFPVAAWNNASFTTNVNVDLSATGMLGLSVPAGAWGVISGASGYNTQVHTYIISSTGTPGYAQTLANADVVMGGIANLGSGSTNVALGNEAAGGVQMALAVTIFPEYIPASAPAAPTNLVATAQTNAVALSWVNNGSGGTPTGYGVLRSTTSGSGYLQIGTSGTTNYTDSTVTDWTPYYYVVNATNASGPSAQSLEAGATPVGLPTAPTGLVGTWGVNMATLNWNPQNGATNWNVLRSTTSGSGYTPIASVTTNNYVDTGVTNWTTYYYVLNATNNFGTGPNSAEVSVTPAVPLTNWIGVFQTPNDVTNWFNTVSNAGFGGGYASFYADAPSNGPSTGCLLFSNVFWTNYPGWDGIRGVFNNLNESNATALEFDFKCEGPFDSYNGIQSLQPSVESTRNGGMGYDHGGVGAGAGSGNNGWVHIVVPITVDDAGNVANWTFINQINLQVVDGYYDTPTNVMLAYANLEFTGAPGYPPVFSNLANPVNLSSGTPSVTLTGTVSGGSGNYLANGTLISVTINGNTQTTNVYDATGDFTINFTGLAGLSAGSYHITYACASDYQIFVAGTNNATSLTVGGGGPHVPTILPVTVDSTGKNLQVSVNASGGYFYSLLQTTNLNPPVVWTTNSSTFAPFDRILTNLVPLNLSKTLYLKYQVTPQP